MSALPIRLARATWRALKVFVPEVVGPIAWRALSIAALLFVIDAERPVSHALFAALGTGAWSVVEAKLMSGMLTGAAVTLMMALSGGIERTTSMLAASWIFWTVLVSSSVLGTEASDAGIRWVDVLSLVVLFISVIWIRRLKSNTQAGPVPVVQA